MLKKYEILVEIAGKWLLYYWYTHENYANDEKIQLEKMYPDLKFRVFLREF